MKVPNCPLCGFNPHWVFSRHKQFKDKDCGMRVGTVPASEMMTPEEIERAQQVKPGTEIGNCRTRFVYITHESYLNDVVDPHPGDIAIVAPNSKGLSKAYCYVDGVWTLLCRADGDELDVSGYYYTKIQLDSLLK